MGKRHKIIAAVKANPTEFMSHDGKPRSAAIANDGRVLPGSLVFGPGSHRNLVRSALEDTPEYRVSEERKAVAERRRNTQRNRKYW